ncbi:MAG TPA: amidase [Methylophilaceae bacterium]
MTMIKVALCGAHMQGLPLNPQLTALGGELVIATQTSPDYKLFKLPDFIPERPGLIRVKQGGTSIALEVWQLPIENYGKLVAAVPAPLGFGTLTLIDGTQVQGFLCEAYATEGALDISALGGWRGYLRSLSPT